MAGGGGSHQRVEVSGGAGAHQHREVEAEGRIGGAQVAVMVELGERERECIEGAKSDEMECIVGPETGAGHIAGAAGQSCHTVGFVCTT